MPCVSGGAAASAIVIGCGTIWGGMSLAMPASPGMTSAWPRLTGRPDSSSVLPALAWVMRCAPAE